MSSRKMRPHLLVVGSQWPPQTFLKRLFRGLGESFDISVASRTSFRDPDLRRLPLPAESWPRPLRAAVTAISGAPALTHIAGRRLLGADGWRRLPYLRRPVDVLYFPWNSAAVDHLPLMQLGIPSVLSCRGSQVQVAPHQPERRDQTAGLAPSFTWATRVHCVSKATLKAAERHGLDASKARIIPPAVDAEAFKPPVHEMAGPPWRLMSVGGMSWLKGFEDALLAVRGLKDRGHDVRFDLVGDGRDMQRLRFAVHDLELQEEVCLHGQVPASRVRELLQRAHIFLLSSLSEGISNAALEAMACGVAVVSTRCGGMEEAIEDGEQGLLVAVQDPRALELAAARLIEDDGLRRRLGAAGRRRVMADFDLDRQVSDFTDLIFEAIRLDK